MNTAGLTNYQLYEIIRNTGLAKSLKNIAQEELNKRQLTSEQIKGLKAEYDLKFGSENKKGLALWLKILLVLFPFPFLVPSHSTRILSITLLLIVAAVLANGEKKKWKEFWLYLSLGLVIWFIAFIIWLVLFDS